MKVDQHEGSVLVGKLLKELYVDSALRRSENLDKEYGSTTPQVNSVLLCLGNNISQ